MTITTFPDTLASFADVKLQPSTMAALQDMNIHTPTEIQSQALPAMLAGRDIIGQARTGSGKTLAFGIPAVELVDPRLRAVQVLVLVPTRELAVQVGGVLDAVGSGRGIKTVLIFGGRTPGPQIAALRAGAQIVVGTPGRVLDLLQQGALDVKQLRFLVLDEADEMLDRGFSPDVERILARTPRERQTALFSATVPQWVNETSEKHLRNPLHVSVDPRPEDSAPIEHTAYDLGTLDKQTALRELLDNRPDGSLIVFGRTKHGVKKLARVLERDGYPVAALQGNLSQNARDRVMEDFRSGAVQILLATNVAARGLDITTVALVINVDLPESPELLTHRVGRTGRMGRAGQAITLLGPEDQAKWRQLERGLGKRIPRMPWPGAKAAIGETAIGVSADRPAAQHARQERDARTHFEIRDFQPTPQQVQDYFARPATAANNGRRGRSNEPMSITQAPREAAVKAEATRPERRERGRRGRHQVICSGCGKQTQVPFDPDPERPVYCSNCFSARKSRRS